MLTTGKGYHKADWYWVSSKSTTNCCDCGKVIDKGQPKLICRTKKILRERCGECGTKRYNAIKEEQNG